MYDVYSITTKATVYPLNGYPTSNSVTLELLNCSTGEIIELTNPRISRIIQRQYHEYYISFLDLDEIAEEEEAGPLWGRQNYTAVADEATTRTVKDVIAFYMDDDPF